MAGAAPVPVRGALPAGRRGPGLRLPASRPDCGAARGRPPPSAGHGHREGRHPGQKREVTSPAREEGWGEPAVPASAGGERATGTGKNSQKYPALLWGGCHQGPGAGRGAGSSGESPGRDWSAGSVLVTGRSGGAAGAGESLRELAAARAPGSGSGCGSGVPGGGRAGTPSRGRTSSSFTVPCPFPCFLVHSAAEFWEETLACEVLQEQVLPGTPLLRGAGPR